MVALSFLLLSLFVFLGWMLCHHRAGIVFLNPLLMSVLSIAAILVFFDIPYDRYMSGAQWLSWLIEPSVVALGYPLYMQLRRIRKQWRQLIGVCCAASVISLTLNVLLARAFGLSEDVVLSVATANITTAIAMATSVAMGGSAALAGVAVMIAGVTGSIFGLAILRRLHVSDAVSQGLAIGSASHALGTATIAQKSAPAAAYASTALILCALSTALLAPYYVPFLLSINITN